jgi:hypothetical protein
MPPTGTKHGPEVSDDSRTAHPPVNATGGEIAAQAEATLLAALSGGQPTLPDGPSTSRPATQAPGMVQSVNLLDLMAEDSASAAEASSLRCLRLSGDATLVIPFTADGARVNAHYLNDPDVKGWILCPGPGCALCAVKQKVEQRVLVPVYDCMAEEVAVLAMSGALRPKALLPQFQRVFQTINETGLQVVSISKPDNMTYDVRSWPIPATAPDGADVIAKFVQDMEQGRVKLDSVFLTLSNETLRALPSVERKLALHGLA